MKTNRSILKKIEEWEGNPMLVAGLYRLFAYLPWNLVPEKYKEFFPEDARETWLKDDSSYTEAEFYADVESEVRAILNTMASKNITNAFGIIPMIFADMFVMNKPTAALQGKLQKIINEFKENIELDRNLAEQYAMLEIFDLLKTIIKKVGIYDKISFDIEEAINQVVIASQRANQDMSKVAITPEIDKKVEEALKKEKGQANDSDKTDL